MPDGIVYATRPLVQALLEYAKDRDPDRVSVALGSRPASELEPDDGAGVAPDSLPVETGVFADFTFPEAGGAVNFVFGVDLGRPAGTAQGRFVSHPDGNSDLISSDDLAPHVLVAIPPWTLDDVRSYDRNGSRQSLSRSSRRPHPSTRSTTMQLKVYKRTRSKRCPCDSDCRRTPRGCARRRPVNRRSRL